MTDLTAKKLLVIVESPNKCNTISNILKKAGYSHVKVVASYGHIMELGDGGPYHNSGVDPTNNFKLNLKITPQKVEVVRRLKNEVNDAEVICLMTDQDREGELIAWSLIHFLHIPKTKYIRAVTHEITPKAVTYAIEHPVKLSDNLIEAALARLTVDKLIGYTLSPIAKSYVSARSVGRCQSAGLKLVADKEHTIQDFVPEYYYDLYLQFVKNHNKYEAKYLGTKEAGIERITDSEQLLDIKSSCYGDYTITDIKQTFRKDTPKPPFCTATFQQAAANKLGLKVKDAMSCAQKLFEGVNIQGEHIGLITYMRTDSTDLAAEFLPELEGYIKTNFGADAYNPPRLGPKMKSAQEGHEALRVVNPALTPDFIKPFLKNELLLKVYTLIWQRTVAAALKPAVIEETSYVIGNNDQIFSLVLNKLIDSGYKMIYGGLPDCVPPLETFDIGEILQETSLKEQAKQTQPPARYKESTLIKELQRREIGRPSTYATIIDTVLSPTRGYCALENKYLTPTERGMQLANFLDRSFSQVINLDYTQTLEAELDKIASGQLSKQDFLQKFYDNLEEAIHQNQETAGNTIQLADKTCPQCQAPMVVRRSRFGKLFYGCSNYPNCRCIISLS